MEGSRQTRQVNPLWKFSTWAYAQPGVEKACLALQDRLGADVNILMFCIWLGYRGGRSGKITQYLSGALKISRDWQKNIIEPLRTSRINFKDTIENSDMIGSRRQTAVTLRESIKKIELQVEELQTVALHALIVEIEEEAMKVKSEEQRKAAQKNLNAYFVTIGVKLDALCTTHVMRILTEVFG